MNKDNPDLYRDFEEDSINIVPILKKIWTDKKIVLKFSGVFFIIGIIIALFSPVVYESQITFVPQTSDSSNSINNGYSELASLAGININTESSVNDKYISPLLYSKIFESDEFSLSILNEELIFLNGNRSSVKDYLLSDSSFNPIGFIKGILGFIEKYTIGLLTTSKEIDTELLSKEYLDSYNFISDGDNIIIDLFSSRFTIDVNKKDGYIRVVAMDKNAFISTQFVEMITKSLQYRIIALRTSKIKEQLDFSKEQYENQKIEFENLQKKLAEFQDSNKNINTAVFLSELQKLQSEYQLQQTILTSLASEYNNNKIKLNKDTPIFTILDNVSVPNQRSEPKRKQIVLTYTFFGIILAVFYVLSQEGLRKFLKELKDN